MNVLTVVEEISRPIRWQSLTLDFAGRCIGVGDAAVSASPADLSLLRLLIARCNIPMTKDAIMAVLYGPEHGRDLRQADFMVARIRRLLAPFGLANVISTVAGRGYAIMDERHDHDRTERWLPPAAPSLVLASA